MSVEAFGGEMGTSDEMENLEHELAILRPKSGDVLVLYVDRELGAERTRRLRDMVRRAREVGHLPDRVGFLLIAGEDARLECVSEEEMARAGWRRA
jgi:hypothetical protein